MKYIIVGIDGTDSKKWRGESDQSHVFDFVNRFGKGSLYVKRKYFHGPDLRGTDVRKISQRAENFISRSIVSLFPNFSYANKDLKIIIIGHSRGAFIALDVARKLKHINPFVKIDFLGLYDAVKRTTTLENVTSIPNNVKHSFHAIRANKVASRLTFGGMTLNGLTETKVFRTSHGGIGGSPITQCEKPTQDWYCMLPTINRFTTKKQRTIRCLLESGRAAIWMRQKARSLNLPI